jgi:hypothetical protein
MAKEPPYILAPESEIRMHRRNALAKGFGLGGAIGAILGSHGKDTGKKTSGEQKNAPATSYVVEQDVAVQDIVNAVEYYIRQTSNAAEIKEDAALYDVTPGDASYSYNRLAEAERSAIKQLERVANQYTPNVLLGAIESEIHATSADPVRNKYTVEAIAALKEEMEKAHRNKPDLPQRQR